MYEPLSASLSQLNDIPIQTDGDKGTNAAFEVLQGEKRLAMEKSPVKTMISQSGDISYPN